MAPPPTPATAAKPCRRRRRRRCGALLGAALAVGCAGEPPPRFDNLVLVVVDALRSDHLPSYGYSRNTAPSLSRLAQEGIQLQGYAASSWTRPAMATLLTGLHPQRHQTLSRADALPEGIAYLPELLAADGWSTAAWVGNLNVGRHWGFDRGFDRFGQTRGLRKVDGRRVTDQGLALIEGLAPPFLLYLHYVDPHDPYRPAQPWRDPGQERWPLEQPRRLTRDGTPLTAEIVDRLTRQYDGEILEVDREIERLLAALDAAGRLDDTLVVVTADHGEELGDHGGLTHGHTLFEEVVRVPLLLWSRSRLPARHSGEPFHQVDLLPTLLEALGRPVPPGLDGRSRWREVTSGRRSREAGGDLFFHLDLDSEAALAVLRPPFKLVHTPEAPHLVLADLSRDPGEQAPLPAHGRAGRGLLAALLAHHNRTSAAAAGRHSRDTDAELRGALAALGYLRADTPEAELRQRRIPDRLDPRLGLAALRTDRR